MTSLGPLPPVPGYLRVVISGEIDNEDVYPWANVLHFRYAGTPPTGTDCADIASAVASVWEARLASLCPAPTTLKKVTVTDLTSDSAGSGEFDGSIAGTRGDDSIPANAAVLISYPVFTRWRGGHPRQYLYVGGNADLEGAAKWTALFQAEVLDHWVQFLIHVQGIVRGGTTVAEFAAIRYYGKFLPNSGPPRYRLDTPIPLELNLQIAQAAQEIASQRRRVGRRKR